MNKKNILVVASQGATNTDLLNWYVNAEQYNLTLAGSDERAIELVQQGSFDLVLADGTDHSIDLKKLGAVLPILDQELPFVPYSGESVERLDEKIHSVFEQKKAERVQRLLILDSSRQPFWQNWIPFSAN
jgi:DNA-binding NtrC family response regulator